MSWASDRERRSRQNHQWRTTVVHGNGIGCMPFWAREREPLFIIKVNGAPDPTPRGPQTYHLTWRSEVWSSMPTWFCVPTDPALLHVSLSPPANCFHLFYLPFNLLSRLSRTQTTPFSSSTVETFTVTGSQGRGGKADRSKTDGRTVKRVHRI